MAYIINVDAIRRSMQSLMIIRNNESKITGAESGEILNNAGYKILGLRVLCTHVIENAKSVINPENIN